MGSLGTPKDISRGSVNSRPQLSPKSHGQEKPVPVWDLPCRQPRAHTAPLEEVAHAPSGRLEMRPRVLPGYSETDMERGQLRHPKRHMSQNCQLSNLADVLRKDRGDKPVMFLSEAPQ